MGAQHLVLDLDFVQRDKETSVAVKQLGAHSIRVRMEQAGRGETAATVFLGH